MEGRRFNGVRHSSTKRQQPGDEEREGSLLHCDRGEDSKGSFSVGQLVKQGEMCRHDIALGWKVASAVGVEQGLRCGIDVNSQN